MPNRPLLPALVIALTAACATARAATITVTTAADDLSPNNGSVSLREAVTAINAGDDLGDPDIAVQSPGSFGTNDAIHFNIPGAGVHTIDLGTDASAPNMPLPAVAKPVVIDGYTQPGAQTNTLAVGSNAVLLIEINGTDAGFPDQGLLVISAGNSTIKGLVINNAQGGNGAALRLDTNGGNTVSGTFVGLDPTGEFARPNGCQGLGIVSSSGNTIGGLSPADRNVISATEGCGAGLLIYESSDNHILNNYLGTDAAGSFGPGSSSGIFIYADVGASSGNIVGGATAAARNVISGNSIGISLAGNATGTVIQGNFIGPDASGAEAVGNNEAMRISDGAHDNTIGGTVPGAGNTIAFNSGSGINLFGFEHPAGSGNAILGNSIFANGNSFSNGLGIDLLAGIEDGNGVTANDPGDPDTGPNNLQNHPLLTSATSDGVTLTISGTLNSLPMTTFRLEFFSNSVCDPSGFGEGETFLGSTMQATDALGDATISVPVSTPPGAVFISATATDPSGNTSEFSNCIALSGTPGPTLTPTINPTPATPTTTATQTATATRTGTPTTTPTGTPTRTPTALLTLTATQSVTALPSNTPTRTPTATRTPTLTLTQMPTTTRTLSASATSTPIATPTRTPTGTTAPTPSATTTGAPSASPSRTPTPTAPGSTVAPTPTTTPGLTASATPTGTSAPPVTATPTATGAPCVGDCNGDDAVTVDELLTMVNIALGSGDIATCLPGDANTDEMITIDEIVSAVGNALTACPG